MKLFFTTYVRPLLEFNSPIWYPLTQTLINKIENVQCNFTNKIPSCTFLPFKRRLEILKLDSQQKRRQIADLVCICSLISGSLNTFLSPHLNFESPLNTRSHNLRLRRPFLNFSSSHQNLITRAAPLWNKLPDSVLSSNSKYLFRKRVSIFCADPFFAVR